MKKTICALATLLALLAGCAAQTPQPEAAETTVQTEATVQKEIQAPVELETETPACPAVTEAYDARFLAFNGCLLISDTEQQD